MELASTRQIKKTRKKGGKTKKIERKDKRKGLS